ncbi:hypothetical protein ACPYIV_05940 [Parabacteroides sp. ASD2025]|uniref:hypothetical protein n=1 Tax=Parabacteroides sp. ASD2025 TaxID=3415987 RepID=UPI003CFA18D2
MKKKLLSFAFVNKTDKDVFINMGQTFFIVNGKAKDYYQERTFGLHDFTQYSAEVGTGQITLETNGYWGSEKYYENMQAINNAMKIKKSVSTTNSVTIKEKEIICIPANSYKILCKCSVNPVVLQTCIKNKDFPNRNTNVGSYDKKTTPLVFKNRIAYGFNKDGIAEKYVESDFWLSSVDNYSQKAATEEVKTKIECYGFKHSEKRRTFKIGGPNMFYQVYSKPK